MRGIKLTEAFSWDGDDCLEASGSTEFDGIESQLYNESKKHGVDRHVGFALHLAEELGEW